MYEIYHTKDKIVLKLVFINSMETKSKTAQTPILYLKV